MKSRLFHSDDYLLVQDRVRDLINRSPDFLSEVTAQSPRLRAMQSRRSWPIPSTGFWGSTAVSTHRTSHAELWQTLLLSIARVCTTSSM